MLLLHAATPIFVAHINFVSAPVSLLGGSCNRGGVSPQHSSASAHAKSEFEVSPRAAAVTIRIQDHVKALGIFPLHRALIVLPDRRIEQVIKGVELQRMVKMCRRMIRNVTYPCWSASSVR